LAGASLQVAGLATFNVGGGAVNLGNQAGDNMQFGALMFNSTGSINISQDSATSVTGTNTADSLVLSSTGTITNTAAASLTVANNAHVSGTALTLGDQAGDTMNVGSLTFASPGTVSIAEDSDMQLAGAGTGAVVDLNAAGITEVV